MASTDVLIVGGGIAGASLAARLAGVRSVTLIESEDLCGRHSTGRSAAFWQASLGAGTPERTLSLLSKPFFDAHWPGSDVPLLRQRGTLHLIHEEGQQLHGIETSGEYALQFLDRPALDAKVPGLRDQWKGAWWEPSCADIDVAAFHAACLATARRKGADVRTDHALRSATRHSGRWRVDTSGGEIDADIIVDAAGAWGDEVAGRCGVGAIGLTPKRRTVVQLRIDRDNCRDLPMITDLHESFYFKGEGDRSVWVCPLDETPVEPCDAAPEELDVAIAIDRFEKAASWPVEAVERKWAGLRTFTADRRMRFGFDPDEPGFFWCVGQGGMGIQTAPAASLLSARLILGEPLGEEFRGLSAGDFAPKA